MHIGILAYVTAIFHMRCVGIKLYNNLVPFISFLIVWSAYLENLTTDTREDSYNICPHGILPNIEKRLYPVERFYPVFYLSALLLSLTISFNYFVWVLASIIIFSSYVHRWIPGGHKKVKRLKEIYIIKNIIPPLGWIFSVWVVPFVYSGEQFIFEYFILIFILFLWSLQEEIKFDVPDVCGDKKAGIKTLPNVIGESRTKGVIKVTSYILSVMLFLTLLMLWNNNHPRQFDALIRNMLPIFMAFLYDHNFVDLLFKEGKKEYCNIGIVWWICLLWIFLVVDYPLNIYGYIVLRMRGNFSTSIMLSKYIERFRAGFN